MSQKHLDIESLRIKFNHKMKELESVFKTQCDLQEKKDVSLENEIEDLKNTLNEKEKALMRSEAEKQKLSEQVEEFEKKVLNLREKLDEHHEKIMTLNEDLIEKTRETKNANDQLKNSEHRLENVKIELSGYLTKLSDTKRKLLEAESEAAEYFGMYNRVNKMFHKVTDDIDFLKEEFENRNSVQEEFIQSLLITLNKNGITEFECDMTAANEIESAENCENENKENEECLDEIEEEEEVKAPLRNYPWWRPAKCMTTIMEVDECCEADDEGSSSKPCEFDLPTSSTKITDLSKSPSLNLVQKPSEIVITIESDEEKEIPKKAIKVDIAIQNDLDAELPNVCSNISIISTQSETSIVNVTDDGKLVNKKSKNRSRKKKNSEVKNIPSEEKFKVKRRYSKVLTIGCF